MHCDKSPLYTSVEFKTVFSELGSQSIGASHCNQAVESFNNSLKKELALEKNRVFKVKISFQFLLIF